MIRHRFVLQDGEGFMLQLPVGPKASHMVCGRFRYWIEGDLPEIKMSHETPQIASCGD